MELKSLGLKTELFFYQHNGNVIDRGDYLVIKTPSNPQYFWGNLLIFSKPPIGKDLENWIDLFKLEFVNNDQINHMTFTWDIFGECLPREELIKYGFHFEETVVLSTPQIRIEFKNEQFKYRKIETADDWEKVINLQVAIGVETENYIKEKYIEFVRNKFDSYKKLVSEGHGNWYGAFLNNELVSDLGLFGNLEFARFQSIETQANYRKKGIAQNLMAFASNDFPNRPLIIHATQSGPAIDMYMRIGFEIKEVISGVCLYKLSDWKAI